MHIEIKHDVVPFAAPMSFTTGGRVPTPTQPVHQQLTQPMAPPVTQPVGHVPAMELPLAMLSGDELAQMCEDWRKAVYTQADRELPEQAPAQRVPTPLDFAAAVEKAFVAGAFVRNGASQRAIDDAAAEFATKAVSHYFA